MRYYIYAVVIAILLVLIVVTNPFKDNTVPTPTPTPTAEQALVNYSPDRGGECLAKFTTTELIEGSDPYCRITPSAAVVAQAHKVVKAPDAVTTRVPTEIVPEPTEVTPEVTPDPTEATPDPTEITPDPTQVPSTPVPPVSQCNNGAGNGDDCTPGNSSGSNQGNGQQTGDQTNQGQQGNKAIKTPKATQ